MKLPGSSLYSGPVWARFREPRHAGTLQGQHVHSANATTPGSRAALRLQLEVVEGRVRKARFLAYGCVATIASADWFADQAEGKTIAEAAGLTADAAVTELGLPPVKRHCALLAADALRAALKQAAGSAIGDNIG